MGILITDVKMPTDGDLLCINIYPNGKVCISFDLDCKQVATAVPVPPHGRLIDADAFSEKIREIVVRQKYDEFYTESLSVGEILRSVATELRGVGLSGFNNAPTIIPADPAEEGGDGDG